MFLIPCFVVSSLLFFFYSCGYHFWDIGVSASLLVETLVSSLIFSICFVLICLKIIHDTHVLFLCFAFMHLRYMIYFIHDLS